MSQTTKNVISLVCSVCSLILAVCAIVLSLSASRPHPSSSVTIPVPDATPKALVDLDCNRPQGHHVWTGDMITPQDNDVMRVSNGDTVNDLHIHGWLCVIAPHLPKVR